jgi:hypothetical protein
MSPRFLLRLEGALVLLAAVGAYAAMDASWEMFAALLLAPDLFMVGYLSGPRVGAALYNAGHTYGGPLVLGGLALGLGRPLLGGIALIWAAHIGMDRALGYGLKHPTGFHDTHLSEPGRGGTDRNGAAPRRVGPRGSDPRRREAPPVPAAASTANDRRARP